MFYNSLYYSVKPLVPRSIRWAVRRSFALRKRAAVKHCWPIMPGSEHPPEGWTGWPDGKKFAFVLTHDVEGSEGVAKCRQLMEMERQLGFRSSFHFIPEGPYQVTRQLRDDLTGAGFEVGVHDLHHDGKLFQSRGGFLQKAARINHYLKEWGSVGFRAGFMLHNLDWLRDLNITYDLSTFDADPFEPQPDNCNTIFPFWISKGGDSGYVELPYTLPQDSTMFLLLQEKTLSIWIEKLDWIARHGGMALVNVHPDYMDFDGSSDLSHTYPAALYGQFLEHVRQKYADSFWHPLPRELAAFAAPLRLKPPRKPRRICMVAYSDYSTDARVARYAEALAERGDEVDVVALATSVAKSRPTTINGVKLFCIQERKSKGEKSALSYLLPILRFLMASSFWLFRNHWRRPYDVVHVHNMPDFLVLAALYPRCAGARVILDIHDIVPEFYASKFNATTGSRTIGCLKWVERISARLADHVIVSNHLWHGKYSVRTGTVGNSSVFINNVDSKNFAPRVRARSDGKFIILFPGGLQWHQGIDIALRAFKNISSQVSDTEFHIYGDGNVKEDLIRLSRSLELEDKVRFFNPIPVREISAIMSNADLGIVPKRADSFGNEAYSTKIMEFMSVGVPVIVSDTKIDRFYFDDSVVRFFPSGDDEALAAAMLQLIRDKPLRQRMVERALDYAARNSWSSRKTEYLNLVDSLCSVKGTQSGGFPVPAAPPSPAICPQAISRP